MLCPSVQLMTSYGPDFLFADTFDKLDIAATIINSDKTTIFENTYTATGRIQYLHSKADELDVNHSTIASTSDILFLCPITNEIIIEEEALIHYTGLKAATIQGWLRAFEADGLVVHSLPDFSIFSNLDIIIMSDDDIAGFEKDLLAELIALVDIVVLTKGEKGADVFQSGECYSFPSYPSDPVDLTGAGDIFSIAFLYEYASTHNISQAASFAHAAASLSIEGKGVSAIPNNRQIRKRQLLYNNRYI